MAEPGSISVIIPCYNGGRDIEAAVASVEAQTRPVLEIVVIDDGSTDEATAQVLARLNEAGRVRLVRQDNKGLAAARNTGLAEAKGEMILPLDCDDELAPEFLERVAAALEASPKAGFAHAWINLTGEKSGILPQGYNFFTQLFLNKVPYCLLLQRRAVEAIGGYDPTMRRGYEDWEFNIRLGAAGYYGVAVEAPLFHYRVSAGGMLVSLSNRLRAQLWRDIQSRNPDLYRPANLRRLAGLWRGRPFAYPTWLLMGLYWTHRLLPDGVFNRLFSALLRFSASSRVSGRASDGG